MRVYTFTTRNRGSSLLLGLLVLGAGAALLVLGLALLAGVAIVGGLLGTGIVAYRMLRGQRSPAIERGTVSPPMGVVHRRCPVRRSNAWTARAPGSLR